jgi:hypothetical protein
MMIKALFDNIGRDELENRARDYISLSVHFLTLRVRIDLKEFEAVSEERLKLLLGATLL